MFKKFDSYYEEGNGYKINDIPSDVNYNTCNVKYTLNNDFSKNPRARFMDSTNIHSRRRHTDVNASNNQHRASGANCSRPMNSQRPQYRGTQRTSANTQRPSSSQRPYSSSRPAVNKKASAIGVILVPIIILIVVFSIIGDVGAPLIGIIIAIAAIASSANKSKRR